MNDYVQHVKDKASELYALGYVKAGMPAPPYDKAQLKHYRKCIIEVCRNDGTLIAKELIRVLPSLPLYRYARIMEIMHELSLEAEKRFKKESEDA